MAAATIRSHPLLLCPWLIENTPLPVLAQDERPRIPNVSGWLKKWQLLLPLECPPPHFEKCWKGRSDICSRVLLTSPCLLSVCFPPCHPVFPALLWPRIYIGCLSAYQAKHHAVFDIHHLLMDCSLIAAGERFNSLLSHWWIRGDGPPTEGPHLLSAPRAPLLTYNGCDTQKITCRVVFSPLLFSFCEHFTLFFHLFHPHCELRL